VIDDSQEFVKVRKSLAKDVISMHKIAIQLNLSETEGDFLLTAIKGILSNHGLTEKDLHLPKRMKSIQKACNKHLKSLPFHLHRRYYPLPTHFFGIDSNPREGTSFSILRICIYIEEKSQRRPAHNFNRKYFS
jgi:hypothetical protein